MIFNRVELILRKKSSYDPSGLAANWHPSFWNWTNLSRVSAKASFWGIYGCIYFQIKHGTENDKKKTRVFVYQYQAFVKFQQEVSVPVFFFGKANTNPLEWWWWLVVLPFFLLLSWQFFRGQPPNATFPPWNSQPSCDIYVGHVEGVPQPLAGLGDLLTLVASWLSGVILPVGPYFKGVRVARGWAPETFPIFSTSWQVKHHLTSGWWWFLHRHFCTSPDLPFSWQHTYVSDEFKQEAMWGKPNCTKWYFQVSDRFFG